MVRPIVWIFLGLSALFAFVHQVAIATSLYWYYQGWFDSVMHVSGGILLGIGAHALGTLSHLRRPRTIEIILLLITVTVVWEVFEYMVGLWNTQTAWFDTPKDIILGISGGLLTHMLLMRARM